MHELIQICYIYAYDGGVTKQQQWTSTYRKVKGLYKEIDTLCLQVQSDMRKVAHDFIGFNVHTQTQNDSTFISLTAPAERKDQQDASFISVLLLLEVLVKMDYTDDDFKELVAFCRHQYVENQYELRMIDQFEREYVAHEAIQWYTREGCFYRMINKALRTEDIVYVYSLRVLIKDIYCQLSVLEKNIPRPEFLTVYRGQQMPTTELENIAANIHGLLSIRNFLSTTANRQLAEIYAGNSREDPSTKSIVFEIKVQPEENPFDTYDVGMFKFLSETTQFQPHERNLAKNRVLGTGNIILSKTRLVLAPYANIDSVSHFQGVEEEYLFATGSIFRIEHVDTTNDDSVYSVKLTLSRYQDKELTRLADSIRETVCRLKGIHQLASVLNTMGQYELAQKVLIKALAYTDDSQTRAQLQSILGVSYEGMGDYDSALSHHNGVLALQLEYMSSDDARLIETHNSICVALLSLGKYDLALQHGHRAMELELHKKRPNRGLMATIESNIGSLYAKQGKLDEALSHFHQALELYHNTVVHNHPRIALTWCKIGDVYTKRCQFALAADIQDKCLATLINVLPSWHPHLEVALYRSIIPFYMIGRVGEALANAGRAIEIKARNMGIANPITEQFKQQIDRVIAVCAKFDTEDFSSDEKSKAFINALHIAEMKREDVEDR